VVKQSTYWPLYLYSKYMRGKSLATHVCSEAYTGTTFPSWLASTADLPLLDVSAALGDDGYINLAVVNIAEDRDMETALVVPQGIQVQTFVVGGRENDIRDHNVEGKEKVAIKESVWSATEKFVFEKRSLTLLRWKA